jgi:hypothetical protein
MISIYHAAKLLARQAFMPPAFVGARRLARHDAAACNL